MVALVDDEASPGELSEPLDIEDVPEVDITKAARAPCQFAPGVPRLNKYCLHEPFQKQRVYLCLATREVFYGGAAGGAKSDAMLMAALQFVDVPRYSALILRKTLTDLNLPEALMDRADEWLHPTDAEWVSQKKQWRFPSGATLTFGYAEAEKDVRRYQSAAFQFIGIDESTQFSEWQYRFLFSRLRRPKDVGQLQPAPDGLTLAQVPLRARTAANPGDIGHSWHKMRFVDPGTRRPGIFYVPSRLEDNPYVDVEEYEAMLRRMYPTEWERLRWGNWEARDPGELFDRTNITVSPPFTSDEQVKRVRYWDMAATEAKAGKDPDYTVGVRLALNVETGRYCVEHVVHVRKRPSDIEALMIETANGDGRTVPVVIEQEPGSEGVHFISYMRRGPLRGFQVHGDKVTEVKASRIRMLEPVVNGGDVSAVQGRWLDDFLTELDGWPNVAHQDQVDAFAGAHRWLTNPKKRLLV